MSPSKALKAHVNILTLIIVGLEPARPLVSHHLAEDGAGLAQLRIDRRHAQITAGLELVHGILEGVVHARHLLHAVAQELAVVVQTEEARYVELVEVERGEALGDQLGGRSAHATRS